MSDVRAFKPAPVHFLSWDADGTVVTVGVDLVVGWEEIGESEMTSDSVEDGSVISHHVSELPDTFTVTCKHSQTPLYGGVFRKLELNVPPSKFRPGGLLAVTQAVTGVVNAGIDAIGGALGFKSAADGGFETKQFGEGAGSDPGNELQAKLNDCRRNAYECTLNFGVNRNSLKLETNLRLLRVVKTLTKDEGEWSTFELKLQRLTVVQTQVAVIQLPDPIEAAAELAKKIVKGNQSPTIRDDEDNAPKKKSLLKMGLEASADLTGL